MIKVEALVFDWDGTLVDIDKREMHCINKVLSSFGLPAVSLQSYIQGYYSHPYEEIGARNVISKNVGDEANVQKAIEMYRNGFWESIHLTKLQEAAFDVLQTLEQSRTRVAIATLRGRRALVEQEIRYVNIQGCVDVLVTREDIAFQSEMPPSLRFFMGLRLLQFEKALKLLQAEPSKTLIVGDSWWDIRGAKQVKAKAVWVKTGFGAYNDFTQEKPDITIKNLRELLMHIKP